MARIIHTDKLSPDTALSFNDNDWAYNGLDCCVTLEVRDKLLALLDNTTAGTYGFSKALQAPILEMSMRGVLMDIKRKDEVLRKFRHQIMIIGAQLDAIIGDGIGLDLNWRSTSQLKRLFYDVMQLPVVRKRNAQTGLMVPTVNREALERLSSYFLAEPLCIRILKLRDLDKKRQFLETEIDKDNRIRTNFNIAGTNTGRLASSATELQTGTNLQNVDRDLRSIMIADPGYKFCNIDLEQGDARNVGAVCWNLFYHTRGPQFAGAYLDACESGDLHTTVCRMAWQNLKWTDDPSANKKVAEALAYRNDSYRQLAKKLGHGTNYYGTPPTMARHTKVERKAIEEFQSRYFNAFPCIKAWHEAVKEKIRNEGQITTILGRRRAFFGRPHDDATLREAIAYEPQSLTADEIDTALLRLHADDRIQLLLQVHDSILFQYPEELENEIVPQAIEMAKVSMELVGGRKFIVPTDAKIGWNWGEVEYDKEGKATSNPLGMMKWKGVGKDLRHRTDQIKLNLRDFL